MCLNAYKLFFGLGDEVDKEAALHYYERAAKLGSSKAMLALGSIYETGLANSISLGGETTPSTADT